MATPKSVLIQDKPVSVYNFSTSYLDDDVTVKDDEINEVKAELLVKSLFPSLGAPKVSSIIETAVSLCSRAISNIMTGVNVLWRSSSKAHSTEESLTSSPASLALLLISTLTCSSSSHSTSLPSGGESRELSQSISFELLGVHSFQQVRDGL